jgi:5-methylcytosine-specific restriction endonuclease McrA
MAKARKWHRPENSRSKFVALWTRQNGICWLCGGDMIASGGDGHYAASFDHVIPRSKGGTSAEANLKLAHVKCNNKRADLSAKEWFAP